MQKVPTLLPTMATILVSLSRKSKKVDSNLGNPSLFGEVFL